MVNRGNDWTKRLDWTVCVPLPCDAFTHLVHSLSHGSLIIVA